MEKEYNNLARRLNSKELVFQIVFFILTRNNYSEAAKIMIENNISIEELSENTIKLNSRHFALLTDEILK